MDILYLKRADMIQIQTWNDFGESHYVGPVNPKAAFPGQSKEWVDGMSHEAFYEMLQFYIEWYKTGNQPEIRENRFAFYHRRHSKWADHANSDPVPKPANWEWTRDAFMIESFVRKGETFEVEVFVGGVLAGKQSVGEGLQYHEIPFNDKFGPVVLVIRKDGQERGRIEVTFIEEWGKIEKWNFNLISRFLKV